MGLPSRREEAEVPGGRGSPSHSSARWCGGGSGLAAFSHSAGWCMRNYDLNGVVVAFLALLLLFFGLFLFYPVALLLKGAFLVDGRFGLQFFSLLLSSPLQRESLLNSLSLAAVTTLLATGLTMPMAWALHRYEFAGKSVCRALLLVPMIMPPFVGAIGLRLLLARYGSLNLFLMKFGLISPQHPID